MPKDQAALKRAEDNPSLKNPALYVDLREQGNSAGKAARISNAQAKYGDTGKNAPSHKGGSSPAYEDRSRPELYAKAKEIGLTGLSRASKPELVKALRSH